MKKLILVIISLIILFAGCAGNAKPVANPVVNSDLKTLDQALKNAAVNIDNRIEAGSKIAALNFNSPHDKFSGYVLDELTANLVDSGKLTVVDRKEIDLIRGEVNFEYSGEVADDSIQTVGRMLGAQEIISGSLTDLGGFYRIVVRVLNVQNASVDVQYRANIVNDNVMTALLTGGKASPVARAPQKTAATQTDQSPAASPAQASAAQIPVQAVVTPPGPVTYKIGDKGPAGGYVFYDKGYYADNWRYLESASQDVGSGIPWSEKGVDGTITAVGTGKQNSELIKESGGNVSAALAALYYNQGGYTDWFLPSKDELNFMYTNLKQKNLGGFSGSYYWSSTRAEYNPYAAYGQRFSDGSQDQLGLTATNQVRPIRAF